MDNTRDLPGYKFHVDPDTGERPAAFATFVNIEPDTEGDLNGVVFRADVATLRGFDDRERNYRRQDVGGLLAESFDGPVWAYVGTAAGRRRYEQGRAEHRAVVSRAYHDQVLGGFDSFGAGMREEFERTTAPPEVPLREL